MGTKPFLGSHSTASSIEVRRFSSLPMILILGVQRQCSPTQADAAVGWRALTPTQDSGRLRIEILSMPSMLLVKVKAPKVVARKFSAALSCGAIYVFLFRSVLFIGNTSIYSKLFAHLS